MYDIKEVSYQLKKDRLRGKYIENILDAQKYYAIEMYFKYNSKEGESILITNNKVGYPYKPENSEIENIIKAKRFIVYGIKEELDFIEGIVNDHVEIFENYIEGQSYLMEILNYIKPILAYRATNKMLLTIVEEGDNHIKEKDYLFLKNHLSSDYDGLLCSKRTYTNNENLNRMKIMLLIID